MRCAQRTANWGTCLDLFEGIDQIPLMTVHKSKGLEYDTVLFIGLDDQMWWSYSPRNPEGIATFSLRSHEQNNVRYLRFAEPAASVGVSPISMNCSTPREYLRWRSD